MKVTYPRVSKTTVVQTREKMEKRLGRNVNSYVLRVLVLLTKKEEIWQNDLHKENKGRFGRPRKYSDSLISSLVYLKIYFDLTLRETEALAIMMFGEEFAPDHDTIRERMYNMEIDLNTSIKIDSEIVKLVADSTGMKEDSCGAWINAKHKYDKKRYAKLHAVIEGETQKILAVKPTFDEDSDGAQFREMMDVAIDVIKQNNPNKHYVIESLADGAYDTTDNHDYCAEKGIVNKIKIRKDAILGKSPARDKAVLDQLANSSNPKDLDKLTKEERTKNQEKWKKCVGYGRRWVVEIAYSTFKRIFSDHIRAKKWENIVKELYWKVATYNYLIELSAY